ncbi:MAG: glycosyltransferase family 39 protein, partial [Acidobacteriaceae bacterium]
MTNPTMLAGNRNHEVNTPPAVAAKLWPATSSGQLLLILALAVGTNTLLAVFVGRPSTWGTEVTNIAASIASGHGFSSPYEGASGPSAWIPPLYPYLLAGIFKVFGIFSPASYVVAATLNIVVHAITCILLWKVAGEVFGSRAGLYAGCALASLPLLTYPLVVLNLVNYGGQGALGLFISPRIVWYTHLTELAIVLLIRITLHPPRWAIYGLVWGLATLLNPGLLALLPVFLAWRLWRGSTWRYVAAAMALAALCTAPWLARNSIVFHRFVFIRDNFGAELRGGNLPGSHGLSLWTAYPYGNPRELSRFASLGELEYIHEAGQEAEGYIRTHPEEYAVNSVLRVGYFWLGTPAESHHLGRLKFLKYGPA